MAKVTIYSIGLLLALWALYCISVVFEGLPMPVVGAAIIGIGIAAIFVAEMA